MKLSIAGKIRFIAIAGVIASSVIILCISILMMGNLLTDTIEDYMLSMQSIVVRMQMQEEQQLRHNVSILAANAEFVEAVYSGDYEQVREIARSFRTQLNLDSVAITDADGIVIARGHSDRTGDDFSHRSNTRAAFRGEIIAGVLYDEEAVLPFTARCDAPILKDGVIIGTISLANDIGSEHYVDNLQLISGMNFTLYKGDSVYMTTVRNAEGERIIGDISYIVPDKGEVIIASENYYGEPVMAAYWPIENVDGRVIGMWSLSKSLAERNSQTNTVLLVVILCSIGIMLILTLISSILGKKISDRVVGAEEASRAKSTFLSTMSHEIRTPMNAILGITEIQLLREELDPALCEALEKIHMSGDLLLGIINDILDLSKIEAGKLELLESRYEIASLVNDTAQLNMMRVGSKPIEFELYVDENIPAQMSGDELRVKQILNNLLSNAFKYTAEGRVNLSVTAEDDDENEDRIVLVVSVSDTGQGMTKEQVAMLYDEYSRFNQEANRTTEGTGLGMNITRNLIQLMSGSISVESEPGVGSTFTVRLPQQRIDSGALGIEVAENLREFRAHSRAQMKRAQFTREPMPYGSVLIVDDVETNIYVAKGLLAPYRLRIDSAESGFAAIEKVRGGGKYDIIFMDHMMPKMDGVEATKHIRGMGYSEPIVALTANAVAGQADIFLGNGFDDFISKPIDLRQMNLVLNKLIRDKQPPEILEAARKHAGIKPHADDVNAQITEVFLRDTAKTLAALEAIAGHNGYSDEDNLRTYIINIHGIKTALANMGNMELSAVALKLEAAGRENKLDMIRNETPAFLLSLRAFADGLAPDEAGGADTSEGDAALLREKLLLIKQACEEYDESTAEATLKELRGGTWAQAVNELLSAIAEHLLHSDFDLAAEAAGDYSAGLSEAAETSETAEPPGIDVSKGLESCNGDQKIYMQILRAYTTNMRALAESVETVTPEDLPDYKTTVHGIKGASASVFAEEVSRLAGALESAAKDGDFDYIRDNNAALLEALRKQICSIESFVVSFENENPKPVKEKPDGGLLLELLAACKDYDMGRADEVMEEIAQFRYEAGGEFVEWLRERVCMVKFAEIEKRLPEFLEGEFKQL